MAAAQVSREMLRRIIDTFSPTEKKLLNETISERAEAQGLAKTQVENDLLDLMIGKARKSGVSINRVAREYVKGLRERAAQRGAGIPKVRRERPLGRDRPQRHARA